MKTHLISAHLIPNHTSPAFFTVLLLLFFLLIFKDVNSQAQRSFEMSTLKLKASASSSADSDMHHIDNHQQSPTISYFELVSTVAPIGPNQRNNS